MNKEKLLDTLNEIKVLADTCIGVLGEKSESSHPSLAKAEAKDYSGSSPIVAIVDKIKNCAEADNMETHVLDKDAVAGRILLPFFVCYKYFPQRRLTSGDVEKVTSELGVKIKQPNVSKTITNSLLKYLDGDSTRLKGKAVSYKLNRKGVKYVESLLAGER